MAVTMSSQPLTRPVGERTATRSGAPPAKPLRPAAPQIAGRLAELPTKSDRKQAVAARAKSHDSDPERKTQPKLRRSRTGVRYWRGWV